MFPSGSNIIGPAYGFKVEENGNFMVATGGTVTTVGNRKIHTFTASDNFEVIKLGNGMIRYLQQAPGGGGCFSSFGTFGGGGGSAGQTQQGNDVLPSVGIYPVGIGTKGLGGTVAQADGGDATDSTFNGHTAKGGLGGGGVFAGPGKNGYNGSGGGPVLGTGGIGTNFSGGDGAPGQSGAGGGAGQAGNGHNGVGGTGGDGGDGVDDDITGTMENYGRGGKGGGGGPNGAHGEPSRPFKGDGGRGNIGNLGPGADGSEGITIISYQYR